MAELLKNGRSIRLVRPLQYTARCGKVWSVPTGAISDGASIPAFLWRLVGTPLVGQYRDAAVVHDYYCSTRSEPFVDVHRMFHEAMLSAGVSALEAAKFYYGVRIGGPTWDELTVANVRLRDQAAAAEAAERDRARRSRVRGSNWAGPKYTVPRDPYAMQVVDRDIAGDMELARVMKQALRSDLPITSATPDDLDRFLAS